ncbi:MAG TPA: ATP-dependent Clp protease proteolytic subunit [Alphaproteobacteria bacterium]|nr:ATP-dependent Clp protease proteolytic subunit [Alphaproteobacteria bacterium]
MPNWNQVLREISATALRHHGNARSAQDIIRHKYLLKLHKYTGRNLIAYYSGFLSKNVSGVEIIDEDKNGLMMAVHQLDKSKGLDLFLHTPGGSIAAAETIVDYLKRIFGKDIRAIVPQIAMSAGTMIACSCREIWMGKHSNLGPIDPQLNGVPAAGVTAEFERAYREIVADPDRVKLWQFIIRQYPPSFLSQCENAIEWARSFVRSELEANMFSADPQRSLKAASVVDTLTDFSGNKAHDRHIHFDECQQIGLNIKSIESDKTFQDLVLTVHHCYMHSLMNTQAFKIVENHLGVAFVKQQQMVQVVQPAP